MSGYAKKVSLLLFIGSIISACATNKVSVTPVSIEAVEHIKSDPFDPEAIFSEAEQNFSTEDYQGALEHYAQVYAYDPTQIKALFGQAQSHLALGDYNKAARLYWDHDWTGLDPALDEKIKIGKILSGIYSERYETPVKAINDGMMLSPNDARLWNAKGQYHDRRGEWMEALAAYLEAMKTGDWRAGTVNNMGMSLLLQGRLLEAQSKFKQALELKPESRVYDNNLRMVYILDGDINTALKDLEEGRAADILNDAGYVAMKRDRTRLANRLFEKALEISPIFHAKAQENLEAIRKLESATGPKPPAISP